MDGLTFTSKVIDTLAWPVVALILGLVFRKSLGELLPTLRKLKAGPVEAEFEKATKAALADATEQVAQAKTEQAAQPHETAVPEQAEATETVDRLIKARSDPTGIIIEGWGNINGELFRFCQQMGFVVDPLEKTWKVYDIAMRANVLPSGTKRLLRDLRDLQNKVAHGEVVPTPESAQDFTVAADRVIELVRNYRKNLANYVPPEQMKSPG